MKIKDERRFTDGLMLLSKGFYALASSLEEETEEEMVTHEELSKEIQEEFEEPVMEDEPTSFDTSFDRATLDKMGYRDLQKVAKDLDLQANGKKEELIARILGEEVEEVAEAIEEVVEEIPEEVEEIIEDLEEEEYVVTKADHIANALEEYSEEDLADVLNSIGISPKGKRQALLAKIVKAVEEGLLEVDYVEAEDPVEEEEIVTEEPKITEVRRQRIAEVRDKIRADIEKGEISEDAIDETIAYVYRDIDLKLPLVEKKDVFEEIHSNLVDDEGTSHEFAQPYEKDGKYACCSKELETLENGNLYCKICEQEYQVG